MNQYNLVLLEREVNNQLMYQRSEDGYVNATAMCKAAGSFFADYQRLSTTQLYLAELSRSMGIPIDLIIQKITTGPNEYRGTWVHPQVAINLAQWCSPVFAVQVSQFVTEWMQGNNPAQKLIKHWQYYLARTSMLHNAVPSGYFSIFHEAAPMIVAIIQSGVIVDDKTVPDISIGQHWSRYWKGNLEARHEPAVSYSHYYPDIFPQAASNPQEAKAYPNSAIADFRQWMENVYLPSKFPKYIAGKQSRGQIEPDVANNLLDAFNSRKLN